MALNGVQLNILEGFLNFPLDDIKERVDERKSIAALQLMLSDERTFSQHETKLKEWDVYDPIKQVREILLHPSPQNRAENNPYFKTPSDPRIVVYEVEGDEYAHYEKKGLLGLSARNDNTAAPVTKEDVVLYIHSHVTKRIEELHNELVIKERTLPTNPITYLEIFEMGLDKPRKDTKHEETLDVKNTLQADVTINKVDTTPHPTTNPLINYEEEYKNFTSRSNIPSPGSRYTGYNASSKVDTINNVDTEPQRILNPLLNYEEGYKKFTSRSNVPKPGSRPTKDNGKGPIILDTDQYLPTSYFLLPTFLPIFKLFHINSCKYNANWLLFFYYQEAYIGLKFIRLITIMNFRNIRGIGFCNKGFVPTWLTYVPVMLANYCLGGVKAFTIDDNYFGIDTISCF